MDLHETLERIARLLARAHDLARLPSSSEAVADLVENAYLLTAAARALARR